MKKFEVVYIGVLELVCILLMKKMKNNASKFLESRVENEVMTPADVKTTAIVEEDI